MSSPEAVSDVPDVADVPDVFDVPDVADVADVPDVSDVPDVPDVDDLSVEAEGDEVTFKPFSGFAVEQDPKASIIDDTGINKYNFQNIFFCI